MNKKQFVKAANKVHKKAYDYSESVFTGVTHRLEIDCKKHGKFSTTPNAHINYSEGCSKCEFLEEVVEIQKEIEEVEKIVYPMDSHTFDELFNQ